MCQGQGWDRAGSVNLKKLHVGSYAGLKTTVVRRARWPHLVPERSLYSERFRPGCKISFTLQKDHSACRVQLRGRREDD